MREFAFDCMYYGVEDISAQHNSHVFERFIGCFFLWWLCNVAYRKVIYFHIFQSIDKYIRLSNATLCL